VKVIENVLKGVIMVAIAFIITIMAKTVIENNNPANKQLQTVESTTASVVSNLTSEKSYKDLGVINKSSTMSVPTNSAAGASVSEEKKVLLFNLPKTRSLLILDEIGVNAILAADHIHKLNMESTTEPIFVVLQSPGGSVFAGNVLVSAIQASQAPVYTICNILCASMAAIIHQYGHKRFQIDRSVLMFHPASGGAQGEVDKMFSRLTAIKRVIDKMNYEIARRANLTTDQFKKMLLNKNLMMP
jgi:ATP-dependent protease ClpP protease subunit